MSNVITVNGNLRGLLSEVPSLTGRLSNATLRGIPVELRIDGTVLQWKYQDEVNWRNLIELNNLDYEALINLPTIHGTEIKGEMATEFITPSDEITNSEMEDLFNS